MLYIISESQTDKPSLSLASRYTCRLLKAALTHVSKPCTIWHVLINTIFGESWERPDCTDCISFPPLLLKDSQKVSANVRRRHLNIRLF